jgi:hypothetical protein
MSGVVCAACRRTIDDAAKLCPYCGADPQTGERLDTQAILQEVFRPKAMTTSESVLEYARQRQGIVIAVSALVAFLALAAFHQYATMRNSNAVTDSPAVPLTEITDVTKKADEAAPQPMPKLDFQYDGRPRAMRTFIMENGATTPPEMLPAQPVPQTAQTGPGVPAARPAGTPAPVLPRPPQQPVRPQPR